MKDMIGDDTGDNISEKNPFYSEMTAQYWAWKNFHESEYIGFCHYRRYFYEKITDENIDNYFSDGTDVLMTGPEFRRYNMWNFLQIYVGSEDLAIMQKVILKLYPEYYKTLSRHGHDFVEYPYNMFVCKRDLFERYARWVFPILFECEKYVKLSPYSRARRVYGYMAEFLMPVYFIHNNFQIKTLHFYHTNPENKCGGMSFHHKIMRYVLKNFIYFRDSKNSLDIDLSVEMGLKNDNIQI